MLLRREASEKHKAEREKKQEKKRLQKQRRQENYNRVYTLHEQAEFLCYINDVYPETYQGKVSVKLEGLVAKGIGNVKDTYLLYSCNGEKKAEITMEELYLGSNKVECLEGGDKRVALYPNEQNVPYKSGDILCKLKVSDKVCESINEE
ncbi:MAG: hypothetical protein PUC12_01595 [Clostridiales bacterium]|nr:hypothetical protein [Clostridiales bacterium]